LNKYISALDTERFGFTVAKLPGTGENVDKILEDLRGVNTKLVIIRIDLADLALLNKLERSGFETKDVQLTYNFDLAKEIPAHKPSGFTLRAFRPEDIPQITAIAETSFNNYGHYFADEKLDRKKCFDIYADWTQRSCVDKAIADEIIVAEQSGKLLGFLSLKIKEEGKGSYAAGVIGAIDPVWRKGGVFRAINIESLNWAKKLGLTRVENNVLAVNYPVNGTYISLNYKIIRSEITLHYWFK